MGERELAYFVAGTRQGPVRTFNVNGAMTSTKQFVDGIEQH